MAAEGKQAKKFYQEQNSDCEEGKKIFLLGNKS